MHDNICTEDFKMRDERSLLPAATLLPRGQWILVSPIVERLSEILEVPTEHRERIAHGMVLAVGPRVRSDVHEGDVVWFSQIQRYELDRGRWLIRDNNLAFIQEES